MPGIAYETVFIAQPEIPTEQVDQLIAKVKETIGVHKGSMISEDRWGRRRLAYPIEHFRDGTYVQVNFRSAPQALRELERNIKLAEDVLRYMLIRQGT